MEHTGELMQKLLLKCPLCKTRRTSSRCCWKCNRRVPESSRVYGNPHVKRKCSVVRSEYQEAKEDEAAERIDTKPIYEFRPCHRCGRLVEVQTIPPEERRKLGSLPVAVECEKPCEARAKA